jgi:hypothetical protein
MKKTLASACFTFLALAASACGGGKDNDDSSPTPTPTATPEINPVAGSWERTSGDFFAASLPDIDFSYVVFGSNGSGVISGQSRNIQLATCASMLYAVINDDIVTIEAPALYNGANEFASISNFAWSKPDADTLVLTNASGVTATFTRIAAVPATAVCGTAVFGESIPLPADRPPDGGRLNLANDSMQLWYSTPGGAIALSPATGSTGAMVTFPSGGQYQLIATMQGADFWLHCNCGNVGDVQRWDASDTLLDTVYPAEFGHDLSITSAAWDGSSLWLAGTDVFFGSRPALLQIDSSAEPDLLETALEIDAYVTGIAVHEGQIWALAEYHPTPILFSLDAATGLATSTLHLPSGPYYYAGLTSLGGTLYTIRGSYPDGPHEIVAIPNL